MNNLKSSDNLIVKEMYSNLNKRFRNLKEDDFVTKTHYEIYSKSLTVPTDLFKLEIDSLTNQEDYSIADNFLQIRLSLMGYLGWLDKNY